MQIYYMLIDYRHGTVRNKIIRIQVTIRDVFLLLYTENIVINKHNNYINNIVVKYNSRH